MLQAHRAPPIVRTCVDAQLASFEPGPSQRRRSFKSTLTHAFTINRTYALDKFRAKIPGQGSRIGAGQIFVEPRKRAQQWRFISGDRHSIDSNKVKASRLQWHWLYWITGCERCRAASMLIEPWIQGVEPLFSAYARAPTHPRAVHAAWEWKNYLRVWPGARNLFVQISLLAENAGYALVLSFGKLLYPAAFLFGHRGRLNQTFAGRASLLGCGFWRNLVQALYYY